MELEKYSAPPELEAFYDSIEKDDSDFLKLKEMQIQKIGNTFLTETGKVLKEAQERFSNNKTGIFGQWLGLININHQTALNLINRINYIDKNFANINAFEALPKSLSYAVAKPSALPEANEAVFNGEIKTLKEYKELEQRLKIEQAEKEALARKVAEQKTSIDFLQSKPPRVVEKEIIRENPKLLDTIKNLQERNRKADGQLYELENEKEKLSLQLNIYKAADKEHDAKVKEIEDLQRKIVEIKDLTKKYSKEFDAIQTLTDFNSKTDNFLKSTVIDFSFADVENNSYLNEAKREVQKRFKMLIDFIQINSQKLGITYE